MKEMESIVRELLDEIGHRMALPAVRTVAFMIRGPIRRVMQAIHISQQGLEEVCTRGVSVDAFEVLCFSFSFARLSLSGQW